MDAWYQIKSKDQYSDDQDHLGGTGPPWPPPGPATAGDKAMLLLDSYSDIRVTDSVSALLISSCDCRVQLLCEPSGSSIVIVPIKPEVVRLVAIGYSVILYSIASLLLSMVINLN